ncbi:MAG TPA: hypothetical protein VNO30_49760 [Kofleriaceae bacterium]|nr:hypothetical protein [Kofleriaceae bacterium]
MVDRHDIDALLIGSLYGELSSADEARLKAHLESHPADRGALEGLTRARDAVRASRIFEVQLEPPQSISALLLQEAVRRAPRKAEEEGWFARLRRSFLMHPAMAAAAMMVLVVGVAGTLYLRQGEHLASPEVSFSQADGQGAREPAMAPGTPSVSAATPAPAGVAPADEGAMALPTGQAQATAPAEPRADTAAFAKNTRDSAGRQRAEDAKKADRLEQVVGSYRVGLADGEDRGGGGRAEQQAKPAEVAPAQPRPEPAMPRRAVVKEEKPMAARSAGPSSVLEVTTPQPLPKDLDDDRPKKMAKGRAQSDEPRAEAAPPPPAAPAAPSALPGMKAPSPAGGAAMGGAAVTGSLAEDKAAAGDADLSWARDQHERLRAQVRAGRCPDAAGTAVTLSSRAPAYYQQNVENDRSIKECFVYINAERERAAETRARAASRRMSDEAAAPAPAPAAKQATQSKSPPAKPAADKSKRAPAKAAPAKTD